MNYNFAPKNIKITDTTSLSLQYKQPVKYNFVLRSGVNESFIIGSGQYSFYHFSVYADKRLNRKSAVQFGTEIFITNYFKEFIKYQSVAYPNLNLDPNTDYKRVGIFIGHELFINRVSLEGQIGYYVYQPYKFDIPFYDRIGMKYYFNDKRCHYFSNMSCEMIAKELLHEFSCDFVSVFEDNENGAEVDAMTYYGHKNA